MTQPAFPASGFFEDNRPFKIDTLCLSWWKWCSLTGPCWRYHRREKCYIQTADEQIHGIRDGPPNLYLWLNQVNRTYSARVLWAFESINCTDVPYPIISHSQLVVAKCFTISCSRLKHSLPFVLEGIVIEGDTVLFLAIFWLAWTLSLNMKKTILHLLERR